MSSDAASAPTPPDADIAALPFEKALAELEGIVSRLERGDVALEESIRIHGRGEQLKAHCERLLRQAEARIDQIVLGPDGGAAGTRPLDPEAPSDAAPAALSTRAERPAARAGGRADDDIPF